MSISYTKVPSSEDELTLHCQTTSTLGARSRDIPKLILSGVMFLVGVSLAGLVGFMYGKSSTGATASPIQVTTHEASFVFNGTFTERPSVDTNAAWGTIFPPNGGFFYHAEIAPDGASLAAYHQLHCLDGIRHAYWVLYDAVTENTSIDLDSLPDYSTPWHTRHCIDFLRQMLMCHADTTIEPVKPELGGIVGFGIKHECKDWGYIHDWVVAKQDAWKPQNSSQ